MVSNLHQISTSYTFKDGDTRYNVIYDGSYSVTIERFDHKGYASLELAQTLVADVYQAQSLLLSEIENF